MNLNENEQKISKSISSRFDIKILLVDDDKSFTTKLAALLEKFNIHSIIEHRTANAQKHLTRLDLDVILLDVMMPGGNGFDFLPIIRNTCNVPVIMLTALDEEDELINGFDLGADDYITKPFSIKELVARLRALKRRSVHDNDNVDDIFDDLKLFLNKSIVKVNNLDIKLTDTECNIIRLLIGAKNYYLSREILSEKVFKRNLMPEDRSIDVHISNLRKKLGPHPTKGNRIRSLRGLGYTLTK